MVLKMMNRLLNVGLLCVLILSVLAASVTADHMGIPHFPGGFNVPDEIRQDTDNDGVIDLNDNCRLTPNPDQENADGDRFGDACDNNENNNGAPFQVPFGFGDRLVPRDADWDGVLNGQDNCVNVPNANQVYVDEDGVGDVCDVQDDRDSDEDVVRDEVDNCVFFPNEDQANADGDNQGDACDNDLNDGPQGDRDADGIPNATDLCANTPAGAQVNEQGCSPAQLDRDGDGDLNGEDNCPDNANADQANADGDQLGDVCDGQPNQNNNQNQPPQPQTDEQKVRDLGNKFDDFEDDYTFFNREYQKAVDDNDDNDVKKYKRKLKNLKDDLENLQEDVDDLRENIEDQDDRSKRPLVNSLDDLDDDITKLQKRIDETINPPQPSAPIAPSQASSPQSTQSQRVVREQLALPVQKQEQLPTATVEQPLDNTLYLLGLLGGIALVGVVIIFLLVVLFRK